MTTTRKPFGCGWFLISALAIGYSVCHAQTPRQPELPKTKVVILGVGHSSQLVAESYQPAVLRAFFDRVKPDAICIERSPQEFARNDLYEFTYEQQYLTIPYAKEHRIPLYPVDWLPSAEDTTLAFNLPDLEKPSFVRAAFGFQGFMSFPEKADLNIELFHSETESDRRQQEKFANTPAPQVRVDFARRLYLYRTFMQAMRILRAANDNRGKTVLVVIGSLHKNDIEQILKSETSIEIIQPSIFGRPEAASIMKAVKREDLLATAAFNLLGVQSKTGNVNWEWLKRIIEGLESKTPTAEVLLLKTRLQVLTKQIGAKQALDSYRRVYEMADASEQFTWTGVKDRSRIDLCFAKTPSGLYFNNFIRLLAVRICDVVLQLQRSRSLLPTPAAALPSAQAHPWRATNGFVTGDNIRNNFSKCGVDDFR